MIYIIVFLVFFTTLLMITFSKDSYINQESIAYAKQIRSPWLYRPIALNFNDEK